MYQHLTRKQREGLMTKTNELEPKENIDKNEGKKPYESPVFTKYEPLDSVSRMIYYYYFF